MKASGRCGDWHVYGRKTQQVQQKLHRKRTTTDKVFKTKKEQKEKINRTNEIRTENNKVD